MGDRQPDSRMDRQTHRRTNGRKDRQLLSTRLKMSDGKQFCFTPKHRKVQCSKCDELFDNDYASCHMTNHHPALITAGYTPSLEVVKESSQPSVSSFFKKSDMNKGCT